ncbi:MAG: aminotransferase class V-fold PLP-dependent enzyme, partial [Anaerovoracaceae bacterium]
MREVYLDYSATTPVKDEVLAEMLPYFKEHFGNPSSLYNIASHSKDAISVARQRLASLINADEKEVFFTSCGTEADNWAMFGVADALKAKGNHIITTIIEHHAMIHAGNYMMKHGIDVTFLEVRPDGTVDPAALEAAITDKTVLVSIMY